MFFAPPKVKSLSQYAEFGLYLGQRDFFIMLAIAIVIHAITIGIYALVPREEVVKIPVRVLNIKFGGGKAFGMMEMPTPEPLPTHGESHTVSAPQPHALPPIEPLHKSNASSVVDKSLPKVNVSSPAGAVVSAAASRGAQNLAETTLSTPKKYVRMGGEGGEGEEIVQRYEQTISLWISQHKIYPQAAKQQGIEGNAVVRIRIDRVGHILFNAIDQSSGNALIDDAVLAMVRASNPVPSVPLDYPQGSQLEFLIPVSFRLQ